MPPPLRNHGNYIVSVSDLVKWLGGLVERAGVSIFTQTAAKDILYDGKGIAGVITDDKGLDKNGQRKSNFSRGYNLRAKVTVLAERPRSHDHMEHRVSHWRKSYIAHSGSTRSQVFWKNRHYRTKETFTPTAGQLNTAGNQCRAVWAL